MDGDSSYHSQEHESQSQQIHLHTALLERMEKSGTDLKSYREDEKDEAEVLHERKDRRIRQKSEMAQKDTDEKDPSRAD